MISYSHRMRAVLRKSYHALLYSLSGLRAAFTKELSFRLEVYCTCILIPVSFLITASPIKRTLLCLPLFIMMMIELLNSAIEKVIDEVGEGKRTPLFKFAKDCGSAAVFLGILFLVLSWFLILCL